MDSKKVFELRKESKELNGIDKLNKLTEALKIASQLFQNEPDDEWVQKAYGWVLIDLCKHYISNTNLEQAKNLYQKLISIKFNPEDDLIEREKDRLLPKIDIKYPEVKKAENLSKNGKHQESLKIFQNLINNTGLEEYHHEYYGWAIYRYTKDKVKELTLIEIKTLLNKYLNLKNSRPSLLHSMILNFALSYSKEHSDFKLYNFFKLWGPKNLRIDDKSDQTVDGKKYRSLVSRVLKEFVEKDCEYDIDYLIENIQIDNIHLDSYNFINDDLPF